VESIALTDLDVPQKYLPVRVVVDDGVSVVVEATNRGTKRVVFLRFWRGQDQSADWNRHLARLVRAVVAAGSEHLLQILDMEVGGQDSGPVVVLEAVKGRTLAEVIKADGPLALGRACRMAIGLARAIQDCHQWGITPVEPTVQRVFLTQFAGQRDFVKVLAPNVVGVTDWETKVRDTVGWVRVVWAALTGQSGPVPPDEETAAKRLRDVTGADEQDVEVLARLVVDGALGEVDLAELAGRLEAAGLADPPSVHPSVSFETRLPQIEPIIEEPGTLFDDVVPRSEGGGPQGRIRPWHLALASFVGFLLGGVSAAALFWGLQSRTKSSQGATPSEGVVQELQDAGSSEPAEDQSVPGQVSNAPPLKFAVAYYSPSPLVTKEMRSLTRYLTRALGRRVQFVNLSHEQAARKLDSGSLQIAVFSPYMYVLNRVRYRHFKLLVSHLSDGNLTYQGFLVVRSDSKITSLSDAKGARICFVSLQSTSGYLFPLALLRQHGIDPQRDFKMIRFSGTHEGVIADLQEHRCDIGAVSSPAYLNAARKSALRMVAVTDRIPGDAYCVTSHLRKSVIDKIRQAFLSFNPRKYLHRAYLGELHRITGFQKVNDAHYDPIRRVHRALFGKPITAKTAIRPLVPR